MTNLTHDSVYRHPLREDKPKCKLIITRGIPGSGKSTWARKYQEAHPGTKRVNRDDLRSMVDNSVWSKVNEGHITTLQRMMIQHLLSAGCTVIVDDTNLDKGTTNALERVAIGVFADVEIEYKDFFHVPMEVCMARNAERTGNARVPEIVIRDMFKKQQKLVEND